jgi:hypothetical protein
MNFGCFSFKEAKEKDYQKKSCCLFNIKTPHVALPFEEAKKMCDELAAVTIFDEKTELYERLD